MIAVGAAFSDPRAKPIGRVVHRQPVEQFRRDDLVVVADDGERKVRRLHDGAKRLRRGNHVPGERPQAVDPFQVRMAVVGLRGEIRDAGGRGELRRMMELQSSVGERLRQARIDRDCHG